MTCTTMEITTTLDVVAGKYVDSAERQEESQDVPQIDVSKSHLDGKSCDDHLL
ncbi:hypothetical protein [Lacinutrix chionoecetis]